MALYSIEDFVDPSHFLYQEFSYYFYLLKSYLTSCFEPNYVHSCSFGILDSSGLSLVFLVYYQTLNFVLAMYDNSPYLEDFS